MASDLSDSDSSEDEEMIAAIMLELALAPKVALGPRLNLDDLSPLECEQLLISPFGRGQLTQPQIEFNKSMSAVRIAVEWNFGKVTQLFAFLDFKKNLKILLQPVGKYYFVGVLLANCHTCLYGSQTSSYFNVHPPSLEMYLSNT